MDNLSNLLKNIPRLTKTVAGLLSVFLILGITNTSFITKLLSFNVINVVPPNFYLWTFFTAGFYETSLINGLMNIVFIIYIGKYLEPIWGSKEFIKFILIVNFFSCLGSFFLFLFLYMTNINWLQLLYTANTSGFSGVIIAFLVVLKQLVPEQEFSIFFISIRSKWIPSLYVLFRFIIFLFVGFNDRSFTLVLYSVFVSWIYLRFYQIKAGGIKGDFNDSFSFCTFFPEPIQAPIKVLSNIVFKILVMFSICSSNSPILPTSNYSGDNSNNNNMSYSAADMDRRRALAVKALEERMLQQQQQQQQPRQPPPMSIPPTSNSSSNNSNNLNISIDQDPK